MDWTHPQPPHYSFFGRNQARYSTRMRTLCEPMMELEGLERNSIVNVLYIDSSSGHSYISHKITLLNLNKVTIHMSLVTNINVHIFGSYITQWLNHPRPRQERWQYLLSPTEAPTAQSRVLFFFLLKHNKGSSVYFCVYFVV